MLLCPGRWPCAASFLASIRAWSAATATSSSSASAASAAAVAVAAVAELVWPPAVVVLVGLAPAAGARRAPAVVVVAGLAPAVVVVAGLTPAVGVAAGLTPVVVVGGLGRSATESLPQGSASSNSRSRFV